MTQADTTTEISLFFLQTFQIFVQIVEHLFYLYPLELLLSIFWKTKRFQAFETDQINFYILRDVDWCFRIKINKINDDYNEQTYERTVSCSWYFRLSKPDILISSQTGFQISSWETSPNIRSGVAIKNWVFRPIYCAFADVDILKRFFRTEIMTQKAQRILKII